LLAGIDANVNFQYLVIQEIEVSGFIVLQEQHSSFPNYHTRPPSHPRVCAELRWYFRKENCGSIYI